jgi:heme-degrading monooxygenase HmoA
MFARVTLVEIDPLRIPVPEAVQRFDELVLPEMRKQPGFEGMYLLATPEGKGMVISLWETAEAAEAGVVSGYYAEQLEKFVTFFRAPPGREHYEVAIAEVPATV